MYVTADLFFVALFLTLSSSFRFNEDALFYTISLSLLEILTMLASLKSVSVEVPRGKSFKNEENKIFQLSS